MKKNILFISIIIIRWSLTDIHLKKKDFLYSYFIHKETRSEMSIIIELNLY